ncbi:hypothetical protein Y032_0048g1670 [Ancylostoma ceylanicum]|nr:hypothetical protein Y032_0048g1670 [Ancylostoma ceylanicum]
MRFFPHISGLMLAFNIIPSLCEISDDIEWCDLYSPIDKTRNDTMVIFHRIRSQYEKSLKWVIRNANYPIKSLQNNANKTLCLSFITSPVHKPMLTFLM